MHLESRMDWVRVSLGIPAFPGEPCACIPLAVCRNARAPVSDLSLQILARALLRGRCAQHPSRGHFIAT